MDSRDWGDEEFGLNFTHRIWTRFWKLELIRQRLFQFLPNIQNSISELLFPYFPDPGVNNQFLIRLYFGWLIRQRQRTNWINKRMSQVVRCGFIGSVLGNSIQFNSSFLLWPQTSWAHLIPSTTSLLYLDSTLDPWQRSIEVNSVGKCRQADNNWGNRCFQLPNPS